MSVSNVVKWTCGALVVCLGMNVSAMEENTTNGDDTKSYKILDVAEMKNERPGEPRLSWTLYCKYKENGFPAWKEDLSKFVTKDFQDRLHSPDKETRLQAFDEISGWSRASASSIVFSGSWGGNPELRSAARASLIEAKALAEQYEDSFTLSKIEGILVTCGIDPFFCDGE